MVPEELRQREADVHAVGKGLKSVVHQMSYSPFVSIIIPCRDVDNYARECVEGCRELDYEDLEIIVLPDYAQEMTIDGVKVIPTGPVLPGAKRNIGVDNAGGEVCAFIDSDAYPRRDWLRNAAAYLQDDGVAAVGGPGLTPEGDGVMQRASGHVLSSFMVGNLSRRYRTGGNFESDDIHSCNLIARKSVLREVGGWDERYWPGEDTLLSLAIRKRGKKLVEASDVVVYHHRKPLFQGHLGQVWRFGLHRGFFAKRFPENSRRFTYALPSVLVGGLIGGLALSLLFPFLRWVYGAVLGVYVVLCMFEGLKVNDVEVALPVSVGIILTHLTYGVAFLKGLIARNLRA